MPSTIASLQAVLSADTGAFTRGMNQAEGSLNGFTNRGRGALGRLGLSLTTAVAGGILAVGTASIAAATQWESAFAGVRKTVDGTDEELAVLEAGLRDLATAGGPASGLENAHTQLAAIAEAAGQLGVANEDILGFTNTIAMLTMATDLGAEEAATMSARFANIVGMDFSNIDEFGSALVALGNNSAATESEILTLAMRLAAAGSGAGMSVPDILGLSAAMKSVGIEAEAGGTAMAQTINAITTAVAGGGSELAAFAAVSGKSADEFAANWRENPTAALQEFITALGGMSAEEQILALDELGLSGIRVEDTLRRLAGNAEGVGTALDIAATGWEENTALVTEAETRNATAAATFQRLKNNLTDIGITIGDTLLPSVTGLVEGLIALTQGDFEGGLDLIGQGLTGIGNALGGFLSGAADTVITLIERITGFELPNIAEGLAGWQPFLDFVGILWDKVRQLVEDGVQRFWQIIQDIGAGIGNILAGVQGAFESVFGAVMGAIQPVINAIQSVIDKLRELTGTSAPTYVGGVAGTAGGVNADFYNLGGVAGAGRAVGGQVQRGSAYIVGESGPELFIPGANGRINPRVGGGGQQVVVNLTAYGSNPYELLQLVKRAARDSA